MRGIESYKCLGDFMRHGQNLWIECRNGHCRHHGVVDSWSADTWFRLHRFTTSLEAALGQSAYDHFRCTKCGDKAGSIKPTEQKVTTTNFFPADEKGWKMLVKRLRH